MSHNSINIVRFILEYTNALLFLYLEKQQSISNNHTSEIIDYINNLTGESYVCTNYYGNTRCYTTTELINLIFGVAEPFAKINNKTTHNIFTAIYMNSVAADLIKISITPDHIFYILHTPTDEWYLISSWIYLYNLNIIKINFQKFLTDFVNLFCNNINKHHSIKDDNFVKLYNDFLSKYFIYKTSVFNNSLYTSNNIISVREILKSLGINDFIKSDYIGLDRTHNGYHDVDISFYKVNFSDISHLKSSLLSNVIKHSIKSYNTYKYTGNYRNDMRNIIIDWLKKNNIIADKINNITDQKMKIDFNNHIEILALSILELIDFADNGNSITYNNLENIDYPYSGKQYMITKIYAKKILNLVNNVLGKKYASNMIGGVFDISKITNDFIPDLNINNLNPYFEYIFKYWLFISRSRSLYDLLIDQRNKLPIYSTRHCYVQNIIDIIQQDMNNNIQDNVYQIIYSQNNKPKISYIVLQTYLYTNSPTHVTPPRIVPIFFDNEEEFTGNKNGFNRLIMTEFELPNLINLLSSSYILFGNTFYREDDKNIIIQEFNVYKKIDNIIISHDIIKEILNYFQTYMNTIVYNNSSILKNSNIFYYDESAITEKTISVQAKQYLEYYDKIAKNLLESVDGNKVKFTNIFFKQIGYMSYMIKFLQDVQNGKLKIALQPPFNPNINLVYNPLIDKTIEENSTKNIYFEITKRP